jgi:hypothetical protein
VSGFRCQAEHQSRVNLDSAEPIGTESRSAIVLVVVLVLVLEVELSDFASRTTTSTSAGTNYATVLKPDT